MHMIVTTASTVTNGAIITIVASVVMVTIGTCVTRVIAVPKDAYLK